MPEAEAKAKGIPCYPSRERAQAACGGNSAGSASTDRSCRCLRLRPRRKAFPVILPGNERRRLVAGKLCWVCVDGQVVQMPEAEAKAKGIPCYPSRERAQAACGGDKPCWVCVDGQVVQLTEAEAKAKGIPCYPSRERAQAACGGDKPCWVCINGRVSQLTEAQARARGLRCYASQEEAQQNCRETPDKTCWVCINGRVTQLTEAQARARGAQMLRFPRRGTAELSGAQDRDLRRDPRHHRRRPSPTAETERRFRPIRAVAGRAMSGRRIDDSHATCAAI